MRRQEQVLSRTALRVLARTHNSKFFRTPALPTKWQGIAGVRTITVPGGPIGMRLQPRDEEEDEDGQEYSIGAVVKGFVGVPQKQSIGHNRNTSDPSPVMLAGISVGAELLGIDDIRVDEMPYDDIMGILRSRAANLSLIHI